MRHGAALKMPAHAAGAKNRVLFQIWNTPVLGMTFGLPGHDPVGQDF
jgi:hypothetical protein